MKNALELRDLWTAQTWNITDGVISLRVEGHGLAMLWTLNSTGEEGKYVLTRLEPTKPQPSRVRFEKRNGYTVGISDQPVSEQAIRDALAEFP